MIDGDDEYDLIDHYLLVCFCVLLRLGTRGLGGKTIIACFALFSSRKGS